jgi:hypothetical protein
VSLTAPLFLLSATIAAAVTTSLLLFSIGFELFRVYFGDIDVSGMGDFWGTSF